jgi:predicted aspartyl protease
MGSIEVSPVRKTLCWWLTLLAVLSFGRQAMAKNDTRTSTLRFDLERGYLIVARGSLGSLAGLNFLVDTGANPTVVDRGVAQKLHLAETPGTLAVLNGSVPATRSMAPSLRFGSIQIEALPVMVEDLSFFQKAFSVRIDAVVGLDVLGEVPFTIDYRTHEINFGMFPALASSLQLVNHGGLAIVEAEVNHLRVQLLIDTGSPSVILFRPETPGPVIAKKVSAVSSIGEAERKAIWLHGLKLGQTNFGLEPGFLVQGRSVGSTGFDGLMSPAALGMTQLAIDRRTGRVAFSR